MRSLRVQVPLLAFAPVRPAILHGIAKLGIDGGDDVSLVVHAATTARCSASRAWQ
jgi:hypothetical protein